MASRRKTKISNTRKVATVALVAVALIGILTSTWLYQRKIATDSKAAGGSTIISFNPSSAQIKPVGQQMSLNVVMNTNQDTIAAAVIEVSYDATIFDQVTYENGTTLPVILLPQTATSGKVTVTLGVEPDAPFKGTAIIGTVKLRVKRVAGTTVSFTDKTIAAAIGKRGNVIKTRNLAEILVGATQTPTVTPTVSGCFPSPTCQPPSGGCHYVIKDCKCIKVCPPTPTVTVSKTPTPTPTMSPTPTPSVTPPEGYNWFQESVWYWAMERWGRIPAQIEWFFE